MPPPLADADRGVSPVVGMALLIAVVVALAAVFGGIVLGLELPSEPTPQYTYDTTHVRDGAGNTNDRPYVNITVTGGAIEVGEDFYFVDSDGNSVRWDNVWTTPTTPLRAGDYAQIDGYGSDSALNPACEDEAYRFVYRPDDDEGYVLMKITVDGPAVGNATSHCP